MGLGKASIQGWERCRQDQGMGQEPSATGTGQEPGAVAACVEWQGGKKRQKWRTPPVCKPWRAAGRTEAPERGEALRKCGCRAGARGAEG
jgi:hypothetical protein